jgi:hypothetical protein
VPTWNIQNDGQVIALTYIDGLVTKNCGSSPAAEGTEADVEGWVFDQAAPGDRIRTRRGVFYRQPTPIGCH